MEYRQLPHSSSAETFSVLGLGLGGIGQTPADEIGAIIRKAIAEAVVLSGSSRKAGWKRSVNISTRYHNWALRIPGGKK